MRVTAFCYGLLCLPVEEDKPVHRWDSLVRVDRFSAT